MSEPTSDTTDITKPDAPNGASNGAAASAVTQTMKSDGAKSDPPPPPKATAGMYRDSASKDEPRTIITPWVPPSSTIETSAPKIAPLPLITDPPETSASKIAPLPLITDPLPAPAPSKAPEGLRLRVKVWTDPQSTRRYLMPTAIMSDPTRGLLTAYAMTDGDTKAIKLTAAEWNALPFYYFKEDGPAPRASALALHELAPIELPKGPSQR